MLKQNRNTASVAVRFTPHVSKIHFVTHKLHNAEKKATNASMLANTTPARFNVFVSMNTLLVKKKNYVYSST
jgi:hypothetical protein